MKVGGCWCVLPMHHPGSQPLIKTSALTSRFLCSEGLRAALPLAGGGQRVKLDMSPSPAINAPTKRGAGLVAWRGPVTEEGARQRRGPEGEHRSGAMEAKTKEQEEVGKAGRGRSISLARHRLPRGRCSLRRPHAVDAVRNVYTGTDAPPAQPWRSSLIQMKMCHRAASSRMI